MEKNRLVKLQPYIDEFLNAHTSKLSIPDIVVVQEHLLINGFRKAYTQGFQDALIEISLGVQEELDKK